MGDGFTGQSAYGMDAGTFNGSMDFWFPASHLTPAGNSVLRRPNNRCIRSWELEAVGLNPRRAFVKRSAFLFGARADARDLIREPWHGWEMLANGTYYELLRVLLRVLLL